MNYKEKFEQLWREYDNAVNYLIELQNEYDENIKNDLYYYKRYCEFIAVDDDSKHDILIESPCDIDRINITPDIIDRNIDNKWILHCILINEAMKHKELLEHTLFCLGYSNDEAYEAYMAVRNNSISD